MTWEKVVPVPLLIMILLCRSFGWAAATAECHLLMSLDCCPEIFSFIVMLRIWCTMRIRISSQSSSSLSRSSRFDPSSQLRFKFCLIILNFLFRFQRSSFAGPFIFLSISALCHLLCFFLFFIFPFFNSLRHYGCGGIRHSMSNRYMGLIDSWLKPLKMMQYVRFQTPLPPLTLP